jgi:hypothetical protein
MANADEFRAMALSFESWARSSATEAERKDFLEMAKTMRQAAAELDASARHCSTNASPPEGHVI